MKNPFPHLTNKKIWLAPLAGLTDNSFRTICKKMGADVVVSEMISADGLFFNKRRSIKYVEFSDFQRPFGIQLFGSEPEIMVKAAEIVLEKKPDFIDLNMGCPVRKVVKRGAGSALMRNPETAVEIVRGMKKILTNIPLSVKIRSGWDVQNINAIDFAKKLEQAGIDLICLHPRTKTQMFSGKSDWNLIKELKENLAIPVIGNGDIKTVHDAQKMFKFTKCDSIMIGRGAIGKPWLFKEIKDFLLTGKTSIINFAWKLEVIKEHLSLSILDNGKTKAIREMRKHLLQYTKGYKNSAEVRKLINYCTDEIEIISHLEQLFLKQGEHLK